MKKLLIYILGLILLAGGTVLNAAFADSTPAKEIIYKEANKIVNVINPTVQNNIAGSFFPGLRGTNQLVIYTPAFGFRTNTNEFGTEAIVENNVVVQLNGADSIIPQNGFVISGHGSAKKWINENIVVGSKVYIDPQTKELKVQITPESFVFNAERKIEEVQDVMQYYSCNYPYYNCKKTKFYVAKAEKYIEDAKRRPKNVQKSASLSAHAATRALENALPYYPNELKGVWIRPVEKTPEDIAATVERISNAGINNIFLETYFHGKTIFPSYVLKKYGVNNQREEFVGFDPLKIWIEEAHKRNIKIHSWFETLYVGNPSPKLDAKHILSVYPQWGNKTKAKYDSVSPVASISEHNGYFIDPANPEVRQFVYEIAEEIVTKYDVDGLNVDYIRYPQSISAKYVGYDMTNWGYSEYARSDFLAKYGIDPIEIVYATPEWQLWDTYRQDNITEMVRSFRVLTQKNRKIFTVVIFPDRQKCLETKMQDWKVWTLNNYVDGVTPLILTCDKQTAVMLIKDIVNNVSMRTKIYAGIFVPFMNGSNEDVLRQIHESRKLKTSGVIFFDYAHLKDAYIETLTQSVFNPETEGVPPKN